jgi:haloalkane dehalogenase
VSDSGVWRSQYPFASRWLQIGSHNYHYLDEGEGRPLLLVHGNPTWSFHFRRLIEHFRRWRRVIAVDHMGCGLSDKPERYPYTLQQHSDNLQRLIGQLNLTGATLVAHDWGGPIGLKAVAALPDRFSALVLINTGAFPPDYIPWRIRACRTPLAGRLAVRGANAFVRAARWMAVAHPRRLSNAARVGLAAPYDRWAHRVAIDAFVRDIPASPRHPNWKLLADLESALRKLPPRPTLLLWGMRDWCFRPSCLERLQSIFPHAQSVTYSNVGHWVLEEAPDQVIADMDAFLAAADPESSDLRATKWPAPADS